MREDIFWNYCDYFNMVLKSETVFPSKIYVILNSFQGQMGELY